MTTLTCLHWRCPLSPAQGGRLIRLEAAPLFTLALRYALTRRIAEGDADSLSASRPGVDVSLLSEYHLTGLDPQWSRCGRLFATPLPLSPRPPTGRRFRANGSRILHTADAHSEVFLEVTCATLGES
jgi:hypothetical protein